MFAKQMFAQLRTGFTNTASMAKWLKLTTDWIVTVCRDRVGGQGLPQSVSTCGNWEMDLPPLKIRWMSLGPCGRTGGCRGTHLIPFARTEIKEGMVG